MVFCCDFYLAFFFKLLFRMTSSVCSALAFQITFAFLANLCIFNSAFTLNLGQHGISLEFHAYGAVCLEPNLAPL